MTAEFWIGLGIYAYVAAIMVAMGISQLKKKTPVGFWSGEKPPKANELSNVRAYNRNHGLMWICYGIGMLAVYFIGIFVNVGIAVIMTSVEICGGIVIMIALHQKWYYRYRQGE